MFSIFKKKQIQWKELNNKVIKAQKELEIIEQSKETIVNTIEELKGSIVNLKNSKEAIKLEYNQTVESIQQITEDKKEVDIQLKELENSRDEISIKYQKLNITYQELQKHISQLSKKQGEIEGLLGGKQEEHLNLVEKCSQLNSQCALTKQECEKLGKKHEEENEKYIQLKTQNSYLVNEVENNKLQLKADEERKHKLKENLELFQSKTTHTKLQLNNIEYQIKDTTLHREALEKEVKQLQHCLEVTKQEYEELVTEINKLELSRNEHIEQEIHHQNAIVRLQASEVNLEGELEKSQQEYSRLNKKNSELVIEIDNNKKLIEETCLNTSTLEETQEELRGGLDELIVEIDELELAKNQCLEENRLLEEKQEKLIEQIKQLELKQIEYKHKNEELYKGQQTIQEGVNGLIQIKSQLEKEIEESQNRKNNLEKEEEQEITEEEIASSAVDFSDEILEEKDNVGDKLEQLIENIFGTNKEVEMAEELKGELSPILCVGITLSMVEIQIQQALSQVELIGTVILSREDYEYLGEELRRAFENESINSLKIKYSHCIAVFMVFTAVYYYDNQYWEYIENYLGEINISKLMEIFRSVLIEHKLESFDQYENAFKNVTPILCHAMLPNKSMGSLLQIIHEYIADCESVLGNALHIKERLNYRLDKPLQRYMTYLGEQWETLLLECEEILTEGSIRKSITMSNHMIVYTQNWHSDVQVKESENKTRIMMPKIYVDERGVGLYISFPEQKIHNEYMAEMRWVVRYDDDSEKSIEPELHKKENGYWAKEIKLPLKQTNSIEIDLILDGEKYRTWIFRDILDDYIGFNEARKWVGKELLSNYNQFILLKDKYSLRDKEVIVDEIEDIPLWPDYKGYIVNLTNKICISYQELGEEVQRLIIQKGGKPYLEGGKLLFGENMSSQTGIETYTSLPDLYINQMGDKEQLSQITILIKNEDSNLLREIRLQELVGKYAIRGESIRVGILEGELIAEEDYGRYEIKIYKSNRILGKIRFNYVARVDVKRIPMLETTQSVCQQFELPVGNRIEFLEAMKTDTRKEQEDVVKEIWEFEKAGQYARGYLYCKNLEGKEIAFTICKQIMPISWGILNLDQINEFKWGIKPKLISLEEINYYSNLYIVIEGEYILKSERINVVLQNYNQKILKCIEGVYRREKGNRIRINLREFIEVLKIVDTNSCKLKLICTIGNEQKDYTLMRFQEKMAIQELTYTHTVDTICVKWEEHGSLVDREILFYPLDRPWEEPLLEEIEDCKPEITLSKERLWQGSYGVEIRYRKDEWGFEEKVEKVIKIDQLNLLYITEGLKYETQDELEKELYCVVSNGSDSNRRNMTTESITLTQHTKIFKTILSVCENPKWYREMLILERIKNHFERFMITHLGEWFKFLLKVDMSPSQFVKYCRMFNVESSIMENDIYLTNEELKYIWKLYPMLALQLELQIKNGDREKGIERISYYIGQQGLQNLICKQEGYQDCEAHESIDGVRHDFRECMKLALWGDCYCKRIQPHLCQELIGDNKEVVDYFVKLSNSFDKKKRKYGNKKVNEEPTREEKHIFLKRTYLEVILDMRQQNQRYMHLIQTKLGDILGSRMTTIKEIMQTPKHYKIGTMLEKRKDIGQHSEYWCGVIAYLQVCQMYKVEQHIFTPYQLQELTELFNNYMKELYERDHVMFEISQIMEA